MGLNGAIQDSSWSGFTGMSQPYRTDLVASKKNKYISTTGAQLTATESAVVGVDGKTSY